VQKNRINCKICKNFLPKNTILTINNAPSSAQGFSSTKNIKDSIKLKIYQCHNCGVVQISNKPVNYYKETIRSVGFSKEMLKFRRNQFKNYIKKYNLQNKKIIEIGCGNGDYLNILNKFCKTTYGIEYSKKNVQLCKILNLNVIRGYICDKNKSLTNNQFDGFICMSFMEHAPNINKFLRNINKILKDESYGIIEVPNFDMILKKKLYTEFVRDHIYYFTKETLEKVLNLNGFKVLKCEEIWDKYIISAYVKKTDKIQKLDLRSSLKLINSDFKKFKKLTKKTKIAIWGAGHQALTVISQTNMYKNVKHIIDSSVYKQNKFSPGNKLKVISPTMIYKEKIQGIIIMAAGYSDEIYKKLKKEKYQGHIAILRHNKFEFK
jgi:2-polyprenyl-3-methyl-5-hydroxy-6-metoxy-1,4-benzoquinol methylase